MMALTKKGSELMKFMLKVFVSSLMMFILLSQKNKAK